MISLHSENSLTTFVGHLGSNSFTKTKFKIILLKCSEAQTNSLALIYPIFKIPLVCTEGTLHFVFSLHWKFVLKIALLTDFEIIAVVFLSFQHIQWSVGHCCFNCC